MSWKMQSNKMHFCSRMATTFGLQFEFLSRSESRAIVTPVKQKKVDIDYEKTEPRVARNDPSIFQKRKRVKEKKKKKKKRKNEQSTPTTYAHLAKKKKRFSINERQQPKREKKRNECERESESGDYYRSSVRKNMASSYRCHPLYRRKHTQIRAI